MKKIPEIDLECTDENSTYLGDGAYATQTEGNEVCVWTERWDGIHFVVLGSQELRSLLHHCGKAGMK